MNKLISLQKTSEILCLSKWGVRRTPESILPVYRTAGGHRRYKLQDVQKLIGEETKLISDDNNVAIYSRVSSHEQKKSGDLSRQKDRLINYCINKQYTIVSNLEEVGSGMNDKRPKLVKLIDLACKGEINKIIIEHRDRLTRFNFNIFKLFMKHHNVTIEVIKESEKISFEEELVSDIISLMTSFSGKIHGKRSHKNVNK
jgi:predicted site-specific integrase-resolvase